jgi:hypothetical protein
MHPSTLPDLRRRRLRGTDTLMIMTRALRHRVDAIAATTSCAEHFRQSGPNGLKLETGTTLMEVKAPQHVKTLTKHRSP